VEDNQKWVEKEKQEKDEFVRKLPGEKAPSLSTNNRPYFTLDDDSQL